MTAPPAARDGWSFESPDPGSTSLSTRLPDSLASARAAAAVRLSSEDRQAIRDTVILSEWATDGRRWDVLEDCLEPEVTLDHAMGQAQNREEYLAVMKTPGLLDGLRHLVLNLVTWGNADGTATALHHVGLARVASADGDNVGLPVLDGLGVAELTLAKANDGRWRIRAFRNDQYVMSAAFLPDSVERRRWSLPREERG